MSVTGQYITTARDNALYVSNNTGSTFNVLTGFTNVEYFESISISSNGKYQLVVGGNDNTPSPYSGFTYLSSNSGSTFSLIYTTTGITNASISPDGSIVLIGLENQPIIGLPGYTYRNAKISTNYGATFSDITGLPQYIYANGFLVQPSYNNFTTSFTGQYMLVQNQFGQIYRSTDYGVTWNLVLEYFVDPPVGDTLEANFKMSMSYNGQYMTAVSDAVTEIDSVDYFANYIWRSSDYGATWTRLSYQGEWTNVDVSGTGNYQITANGVPYVGYTPQPDNYIYQSTNYGTTWTPLTVAGNRAWTSVAINR